MRKIAALALIAASPLPVSGAAMAEPTASGPHIVVEGNRMICRRAIRTSSRMRTGRICRTQAEWRNNGVNFTVSADNVEDAQNALDMYGEKVSTNCTGGMGGGHNTPLGPR